MGSADSTYTRLNVNMTKRAARELEALNRETGMSKTDLINRSVSLYLFVTDHLAAGNQLFVRKTDGETMQVHIQ